MWNVVFDTLRLITLILVSRSEKDIDRRTKESQHSKNTLPAPFHIVLKIPISQSLESTLLLCFSSPSTLKF